MNKLALLLIIISLNGCFTNPMHVNTGIFYKPEPYGMYMDGKPRGNKMFNLGWDHGCETGSSTLSPSTYKSAYTYRQEPSLIQNKDYYNAWKDAYTYCRQYTFRWTMFKWDADNFFGENK